MGFNFKHVMSKTLPKALKNQNRDVMFGWESLSKNNVSVPRIHSSLNTGSLSVPRDSATQRGEGIMLVVIFPSVSQELISGASGSMRVYVSMTWIIFCHIKIYSHIGMLPCLLAHMHT